MASGNLPAAPRAKFSGLPWEVQFRDVAASAGLATRAVSGNALKKKYIVEANGMGAAFLDYDNDGRLDLFLPNGSSLGPTTGARATHHLYRNVGGGQFRDVSQAAGVARPGWGNGVCTGDFDNDSNTDFYVTQWGVNLLFRNQGDGTFRDVAAAAGVAGPPEEWNTGCTFLDYDRDGHLDLLVVSYAGFDPKTTPLPGSGPGCLYKEVPVFCGPRGLPFGRATLYRNRGDGRFEDVSVPSGVRKPGEFYAFTAGAADFNRDGWVDIYIACDSSPSLYFRNNRDGTFSEVATQAGIAFNEHGTVQAGMGIAFADYDNDGWLDITKTNFSRDYPNLYRNLSKGWFEDLAAAAGLAVNPQYVLWGTGLEDFDNDGWRDLLQVGGHVYPDIAKIDAAESYANPRLVYRNLGQGRFEDVSSLSGPGISARHSSRGAAFGDFDNDGDVDVVIMNMEETPSLLRNDRKNIHAWAAVALRGTKSNRGAIGAVVTLEAGSLRQTATLTSQSSFLSANDPRLHFGLSSAKKIDKIAVQWPSGTVEEFGSAPVGQLLLLEEGSGSVKASALAR